MYLEDVLQNLNIGEINSLELVYKWGCDGSRQRQYKQKFENSFDSDANIFQSSLVPPTNICQKHPALEKSNTIFTEIL